MRAEAAAARNKRVERNAMESAGPGVNGGGEEQRIAGSSGAKKPGDRAREAAYDAADIWRINPNIKS